MKCTISFHAFSLNFTVISSLCRLARLIHLVILLLLAHLHFHFNRKPSWEGEKNQNRARRPFSGWHCAISGKIGPNGWFILRIPGKADCKRRRIYIFVETSDTMRALSSKKWKAVLNETATTKHVKLSQLSWFVSVEDKALHRRWGRKFLKNQRKITETVSYIFY